jgi:hypothetical protein
MKPCRSGACTLCKSGWSSCMNLKYHRHFKDGKEHHNYSIPGSALGRLGGCDDIATVPAAYYASISLLFHDITISGYSTFPALTDSRLFPARFSMKIFGVGLNQTGTTTLGVCLRHWGFRHTSFDETAFSMRENADTKALLARTFRFQSAVRNYFCDRPHGLLEVYREAGDKWWALAVFPGTSVPDTPFLMQT